MSLSKDGPISPLSRQNELPGKKISDWELAPTCPNWEQIPGTTPYSEVDLCETETQLETKTAGANRLGMNEDAYPCVDNALPLPSQFGKTHKELEPNRRQGLETDMFSP